MNVSIGTMPYCLNPGDGEAGSSFSLQRTSSATRPLSPLFLSAKASRLLAHFVPETSLSVGSALATPTDRMGGSITEMRLLLQKSKASFPVRLACPVIRIATRT
jgi:hypothetical protein